MGELNWFFERLFQCAKRQRGLEVQRMSAGLLVASKALPGFERSWTKITKDIRISWISPFSTQEPKTLSHYVLSRPWPCIIMYTQCKHGTKCDPPKGPKRKTEPASAGDCCASTATLAPALFRSNCRNDMHETWCHIDCLHGTTRIGVSAAISLSALGSDFEIFHLVDVWGTVQELLRILRHHSRFTHLWRKIQRLCLVHQFHRDTKQNWKQNMTKHSLRGGMQRCYAIYAGLMLFLKKLTASSSPPSSPPRKLRTRSIEKLPGAIGFSTNRMVLQLQATNATPSWPAFQFEQKGWCFFLSRPAARCNCGEATLSSDQHQFQIKTTFPEVSKSQGRTSQHNSATFSRHLPHMLGDTSIWRNGMFPMWRKRVLQRHTSTQCTDTYM